jgi:protein-tyrosine phosphatase
MLNNDLKTQRILFVCLGNICCSPTAEGVMLHLLKERGITSIVVDSADHVGEGADRRSQDEANRRGIQLPSRARQFVVEDFERFDWIVAMDTENQHNISGLARSTLDQRKIHLFRDFTSSDEIGLSVPDPYYENNFSQVFDLCVDCCIGLLKEITLGK